MGLRHCVICKSQKYAITKEPLIIGLFGGKWPVQIRRLKGLCHTVSCKSQRCHMGMSHVTYEWVVAHMNESCHVWMSRVTHEWVTLCRPQKCAAGDTDIYMCISGYIYIYRFIHIFVYICIHIYVSTHIYVCTIYGSIHIFVHV